MGTMLSHIRTIDNLCTSQPSGLGGCSNILSLFVVYYKHIHKPHNMFFYKLRRKSVCHQYGVPVFLIPLRTSNKAAQFPSLCIVFAPSDFPAARGGSVLCRSLLVPRFYPDNNRLCPWQIIVNFSTRIFIFRQCIKLFSVQVSF